jgi:hypothetical protein
MPLQEQQNLLARLYTDNSYRAEFLKEPSSFGESIGIPPEEAAALADVAACEVEWFAESLVSKRLREVRKMLPLTAQELGAREFDRRFREFCEGYSPTGVKKHLEDSLAFTKTLTGDPSVGSSERVMARFESARLTHNAFGRRVSFCLLRSDPRRMTDSASSMRPRGLGIWVAIGGWSRIFFRSTRKMSES